MQTHLADPAIAARRPDLKVDYVLTAELAANPRNARKHSRAQIRKLADAINEYGFTSPILVDSKNRVIAGHARLDAARLLGLKHVPVIRLETLTPAQIRAYIIFDNRIALESTWDTEILKVEIQELVLENSIDISMLGFEVPELDLIINSHPTRSDPADEIPVDAAETVTKSGDLWYLREHRILCGDARSNSSFESLMGARRASMVFADPPYNVLIHGHASGNGKTHHAEFAMASGEMTSTEFRRFLTECLTQLSCSSLDGAVHFICMDWKHMSDLQAAAEPVYDSLLNVCVWCKDNGGLGSFYRSQHEMIFVYKSGAGAHRNNIQLGKFGRNRTNVWRYPGANSLSRQGSEGNLLAMHPTVKPIALIANAILDCSARGEIVLDSFLGSGSTLLAAERVGRICHGMEIEPKYVDLAIHRWQQLTGERAVHAVTGAIFDEAGGVA